MRFLSVACLFAFISPTYSQDSKPTIDLPTFQPIIPQPIPLSPSSTITLNKDQWYIIGNDTKLVIDQVSMPGEVSITLSKKKTLVIPAEWAFGRKPDVDDPRFCTISANYLYEVKVQKDGKTILLINPTTNKLDSSKAVIPFTAKDFVQVPIDVKTGTGPQPPPKPIDPVDPIKPVVTSFRVFLVFESGATYTPAINSVLYGKAVEDWLVANCTGGKDGFRRRDQSLGGESDAKFAAMWAAIQPNITTTPCVAVEVNGKVEIIPLEATPAAMIAKLQSYKGK